MKLILICDYRKQFYSSLRVSTGGMDLVFLKESFNEKGIQLEILSFDEIDFKRSWEGQFILYQSSEDRGLYYKSYISDMLMMLKKLGAILIPSFECFYAHENKAYQALLRRDINIEDLIILNSKVYGTYEEIVRNIGDISYPAVVKTSDGCQSKGVALVSSEDEYKKKAKAFTSTFNLKDYLRFRLKLILKRGYVGESSYRKKIVVQEFVPNLAGDYKVLVYGDKVFALNRKVRKNDFRASGSGLFDFEEFVPNEVLNVARELKIHFSVPYISADIAYDAKKRKCYLIEYQFLMFGTYTLELSPHYFTYIKGEWSLTQEKSKLEEVFSETIFQYLKKG